MKLDNLTVRMPNKARELINNHIFNDHTAHDDSNKSFQRTILIVPASVKSPFPKFRHKAYLQL